MLRVFVSQQTCVCLHLSLLLVGAMASFIKSAMLCALLCMFHFSSLTACLDPLKDEKLQWAMKHLQGFNWTATFTTGGCSIAQARVLVEAARVGVQDMLFSAMKYKVGNKFGIASSWTMARLTGVMAGRRAEMLSSTICWIVDCGPCSRTDHILSCSKRATKSSTTQPGTSVELSTSTRAGSMCTQERGRTNSRSAVWTTESRTVVTTLQHILPNQLRLPTINGQWSFVHCSGRKTRSLSIHGA